MRPAKYRFLYTLEILARVILGMKYLLPLMFSFMCWTFNVDLSIMHEGHREFVARFVSLFSFVSVLFLVCPVFTLPMLSKSKFIRGNDVY